MTSKSARSRDTQQVRARGNDLVAEDVSSVVPDIIARLNRDPEEAQDVDDRPQAFFLDFAGQRMYYLMHHVFISEELSIYLVVISLAEALDATLADEDCCQHCGGGC